MRRAEARVGTWLQGKWKLDQLVGVGGMAAVYAATHRNGKRVAIKLLHLELSLDVDARDRFLREGYVANKVGHVGAVAVLDDAAAEDGSIFLVMELLEGLSLADLSEQRADCVLDLPQTLNVADQLLDVLAAAHRAGIVHRDIKPENIFVTQEGRVKLLDFGIAKLREGESAFKTRTGNSMGTPAFMAPEQAAGRWSEVGAHSDLWAVGATMYTLLTGAIVHDGDTAQMVMVNAITKPAPSIALRRPDLPPALVAVIDKALAFHPTARFSNAHEMQQALRSAAPVAAGVSSQLAVAARQPKLQQSNQAAASREDPAATDEAAITIPKSPEEAGARRKLLWPLLAAALGSGIAAVAFTALSPDPSGTPVAESETASTASLQTSPTVSLATSVQLEQTTASASTSASPISTASASSSANPNAAQTNSSKPSAQPPRSTANPAATGATGVPQAQKLYDRRK